MGVENIEKYSLRFSALKVWMLFWHNIVFYRKVVYAHREKVRLQDHLIFTPNHQNALMDALAVEFSFKNQFVFVARSDIFKNKFIARLLYFLKILPVYRIRDGYESLRKNEIVFKKTLDIIRNKNGFVILPEGNHAGFRRLRALKKGFARIAFQAEEASGFSLNIKIVPVGINYSNYEDVRSNLLVVFGDAFPVSEFYEAYRSHPAKAYNQIKAKLSERLKPLMIHIDSKYYEAYDFLRKAYRKEACRQMQLNPSALHDRFKAEKDIIARLRRFETKEPEAMEKLAAGVKEYSNLLRKMKLQDIKPVSAFSLLGEKLLLLVASPLFLYGYINNLFPWYIITLYPGRIKDPQFRSSVKFVLSSLFFPLFYLIQTLVFYLLFHQPWLTLAYFVSLPLSAAIAWNYVNLFRRFIQEWRYLKRSLKKDPLLLKARELYPELMTEMGRIFRDYK
jgi:1-acyl-sn-glycerol-3-phosphate acyltransferase